MARMVDVHDDNARRDSVNFTFNDAALPSTVSDALAQVIIAQSQGDAEDWGEAAARIVTELKTRIPELLRDEALSTRDITQLLSLLGSLGVNPTEGEDNNEDDVAFQSTSMEEGSQRSRHESQLHTYGGAGAGASIMTSSRPQIAQMSVEVLGSNEGIHSVDRTPAHSSIIRPSRRPSSASDLQQRQRRPSARGWNSDARTEYGQLSSARRTSVSLLRDFPSVSADVNGDGSDEGSDDSDEVRRRNLFSERDRRDSTLSKKEIVELSKRLHGDAKRRDSTRLDLSVKAKSKLYTHQPELSPATKQMTVDMAPFRERQETHMLRKQERLRRYEEERMIASRREEAELRPVPKISPMARTLHRSLDDLMVWHERKTQANRLKQMQASAAENEELTFSPSINSKSKYLAAARAFRGESKARVVVTPTNNSSSRRTTTGVAIRREHSPHAIVGDQHSSETKSTGKTAKSVGRRPASATTKLGIEKDWYGFA